MASKAEDPFYLRKPVPDELIQDVGISGLTSQEEYLNRERKYSLKGSDLRKFSNPKNTKKELDPHYARKPVPKSLIAGVGETGLSPDEEFLNRERKYSLADGSDLRKFSNPKNSGGQLDPHYARKAVTKAEIVGVGDTGNEPSTDYAIRERKQSLFQLSSDPFQIIAPGDRHRASIVDHAGAAAAASAATMRRKSSVAPHVIPSHAREPDTKLATIDSTPELPPVHAGGNTAAQTDNITRAEYATLDDPESVGPHEKR